MLEGYAKLKLNSVYGLYNSIYSPLYQPSVSYATAINGQLMLAMLIEELDLNGIKVLGTNTDSVTVMLKKHQLSLYHKICKQWEEKTKMSLDHDEFEAIYEQSCNNYIALAKEGVKAKGFFSTDLDLKKGYAYPVVKKALIEYFINKIPIEKTIQEHDDIYDFCLSTRMGVSNKTGNRFEAYHHGVKLQRTNRYYAAKGPNAAYLYKSSDGINMEHVLKDSGVVIFNKYKELTNYDINYDFYYKKCREIINAIEPRQLNLF